MDYQSFKDHLVTYLWKAGDTQLIASLDNLVKMGEAKLNRELRIERRHSSVTILANAQRESLPFDYHSIREVVDLDNGAVFKYVSPAELEGFRGQVTAGRWLPYYSVENTLLLLVGPTAGGRKSIGPTAPVNPQNGDLWVRTTVSPGTYTWFVDADSAQWVQLSAEFTEATASDSSEPKNIVVHYISKVPDFKATDASWLADEQLDLLTYATLWNTAAFLREDERIQVWQSLYQSCLDVAISDSELYQVRGVTSTRQLPRQAGVHRRR